MRINQGMTLMLLGLIFILIFSYFGLHTTICYFIIGFSATRFNDYWELNKEK
jgi:hypothetical protein